MNSSHSTENVRGAPDRVLVDIATYVQDYEVTSEKAFDVARLCVSDSLACAFAALDVEHCARLLGPIVPGTVVPNGSRVPGTHYELDPVTAAFNLGAMIRWSDLNDAFTAACGGHPSDNLAGILMLADHLSRQRIAAGGNPLIMREVLEALIKAYEIQGCIAIENDFFHKGSDHNILVRVATVAVLTRMLGGTLQQIINAVSNAWVDTSLVAYRYAPNAGSRKNWACGDASSQAVKLAMMAIKGDDGYPAILTARQYGFYDACFEGKPFSLPQAYADYVIQNSMFKLVPAGMHSQSAVECAFRLHSLVKDRLDDVERVDLFGHIALIDIMGKTGPLYNPDDRDHCVQYVVAVGLIAGKLTHTELEDAFAADPRVDRLREKIVLTEEQRYTKDFYDPAKRSSANAIQVTFKDGTKTNKEEEEYPLGHQRRRDQAGPALRAKLDDNLRRRFPAEQCQRILATREDSKKFDSMPVNEFVELLIPRSA